MDITNKEETHLDKTPLETTAFLSDTKASDRGQTCVLLIRKELDSKQSKSLVLPKENSEQKVEEKLLEKSEEKSHLKTGWRRYIGLVLTICSAITFAFVGLIVKLSKDEHVLNLAFFRFFGMFVLSSPILIWARCTQKVSVFEPIWPLTQPKQQKTMAVLFGRAFVGFAALICHFLAVQHMPVADAVVIGSCSSVFVTLVAHVFLGEKWGFFPIATALLTVLGVVIISRPPLFTGSEFNMDILIGSCLAFARMMLTSVAIVFIRYLREVHVSVVLVATGFLQLMQNTSVAVITGVFSLPTDPYNIGLAVALGVVSFMGQVFLTLALKCEQAGPFAIVRTSADSVFAFIVQFIFLGVVPDMFSLLGSIVVILAVFLTVFRNWLISLPEGHQAKKTYWVVLK